MNYILSFLFLDGFVLWTFFLIMIVLITALVENGRPAWSSFFIIGTILLFQFYSTIKPITFVMHYPMQSVIGCVLYLLIGVLYVRVKWYSRVRVISDRFFKVKDRLFETVLAREEYKMAQTSRMLNDAGLVRLYELAAREIGEKSLPIKVSDYKTQLYLWWVFWPLSLAWTCVDDPLKRIWQFVYRWIAKSLQSTADRSVKLTSEGTPVPKDR